MEAVKAGNELDKLRRLDCLKLAVEASEGCGDDAVDIVRAADSFWKFVDQGTVPALAEAEEEDGEA